MVKTVLAISDVHLKFCSVMLLLFCGYTCNNIDKFDILIVKLLNKPDMPAKCQSYTIVYDTVMFFSVNVLIYALACGPASLVIFKKLCPES